MLGRRNTFVPGIGCQVRICYIVLLCFQAVQHAQQHFCNTVNILLAQLREAGRTKGPQHDGPAGRDAGHLFESSNRGIQR